MTRTTSSTYAFDNCDGFNRYLIQNRSVENCCAFIKDIISRSTSILDIGCGPGSITQGLAKLAPEAEVIGVDISENQIQLATELAKTESSENLSFQQASIFELPFADNSFDLIYCQTVFVHIPEHKKALAETKRVLKPKGVLAIREVINSYAVLFPVSEILQKLKTVFYNGLIAAGGSPDIGMLMGEKLLAAGFQNLKQSVAWERSPEDETKNDYYINIVSPVIYGELGGKAVRNGWITEQDLEELETVCLELSNNPNAMWAIPFIESIAMKP